MFVYNYLVLFTIKILVPLTAFTKLIAIFYTKYRKLELVYLTIKVGRTLYRRLDLVDYLD